MSLASINAGRDEDARRDVTSVASSLASLGADEIDTNFEGLFHMLGMANHVHNNDAGFVELIDCPLGRNADGGDKEGCFLLDDDFDEFRELTIGIICLLRGKINTP